MKNPLSSGLLDYLHSLDPMIVFLIIIIAVTEKFVVGTVYSRLKIGIAGLNPTQGEGIRLQFFYYIVLGRQVQVQVQYRYPRSEILQNV